MNGIARAIIVAAFSVGVLAIVIAAGIRLKAHDDHVRAVAAVAQNSAQIADQARADAAKITESRHELSARIDAIGNFVQAVSSATPLEQLGDLDLMAGKLQALSDDDGLDKAMASSTLASLSSQYIEAAANCRSAEASLRDQLARGISMLKTISRNPLLAYGLSQGSNPFDSLSQGETPAQVLQAADAVESAASSAVQQAEHRASGDRDREMAVSSEGIVTAILGGGALQDVTKPPASQPPVTAQTNNAAPQITPGNAQQNAPNTTIANSPLPDSDVLPLLRATSALSVATQPKGMTAYVTVPDTPAKGMADPNRTIVGKMADGRWVGIVPLDSESSAGIVYALMWVWTNGRAQFVGEIPAENGGLGQLNIAVRDGAIDLSWPVSATAMREKVLTLDGIRLRPLSDQIVAKH